ncbi:MAG: NfeD family protein, partial [Burkholderiales bacterium]|nr:NfeD family protein [Burkholderiales bacterium]
PRPAPADSNRDVNLDIGQVVEVTHWDEAHSARVNYRGAGWSVDYVGSAVPRPGRFEIVALDGNRLRVREAQR